MTQTARAAHSAAFHALEPQSTECNGTAHWITRGANFVVVASRVQDDTVLERNEQPDEYMLLLPQGLSAEVQAGSEIASSAGDALFIVPPGASRVTVRTAGWLYRVFSQRAQDIAGAAENAASYADGAPDVAPLTCWPDPVGGWKLRHYRLADHVRSDNPMRLFRCSNLMINVFVPQPRPRDIRKMTPHSHEDFEQGSLLLAGSCVHHMRYPWTADLNAWREDEHTALGSPSLIVIPPRVIHTTQTTDPSLNWLVDIFAPPRADFSLKPGLVRNADEYPLPDSLAQMAPVTGPLA